MSIYNELKARGFVYQETDAENISKTLDSERVAFYIGFDPTGSSLHVGHLLPIMAMRLLQKAAYSDCAGRRRHRADRRPVRQAERPPDSDQR